MVTTNSKLSTGAGKLNLKIYDCGYADTGAQWRSDVVNPPFSRLYYILGGDGWIESAHGKRFLRPGHCYLLPGNYSFKCGCGSQMRQLYFHIALMEENGRDLLPYLAEPLEYAFSGARAQALYSLTENESVSTAATLHTQGLLLETLAELFDLCRVALPEKAYSPCVSRALQYIGQNVSAQLTLEEVTHHSFVSQTTLSRHFRRELDMSVSEYIENLVFTQAQCLLRDKTLSIGEISEKLGFCDQFYFSSRFRHRYMESPKSYRNGTFT